MEDRPLIAVDELQLSFQAKRRRIDVLKGISLGIGTGERIALLGPSGAGKSSLLYCLAGLLSPTRGAVRYAGVDLAGLSEAELAEHRLRHVGIVYQAFHLLQGLDALANVALPIRLAGASGSEATDRATTLLERVGLGDRAHHRPGQLSGGEQQRVAVARAIANGPNLLLADEPTGNLDDGSAGEVLDLLTDRSLGPSVVVIATHDTRIASRIDRQVRILDGRVGPDGNESGPEAVAARAV